MREPRVRRRLSRILKEVKMECGDSNASSDDDGQSVLFNSNKFPQTYSGPSTTAYTVSKKRPNQCFCMSYFIFACVCRLILVDSGTTVPLLSNTHSLTQSSSQPLHSRYEDYWSVISANLDDVQENFDHIII